MDKNYVESSLKRFLKRKVKITMGFVVAFMIMGTGVFAEAVSGEIESTAVNDKTVELSGNTVVTGNVVNTVIDTKGHDLTIKGKLGKEEKNINISGNGNIIIDSNDQYGIHGNNWSSKSEIDIKAKNLSINNVKVGGIYNNGNVKTNIDVENELRIENTDKNISASQGGINAAAKTNNSRPEINITAGSIYSDIGKYAVKVNSGGIVNITSTKGDITFITKKSGTGTIDMREGDINKLNINSAGKINIINTATDFVEEDYKNAAISLKESKNNLDIVAKEDIAIKGNIGILASGVKTTEENKEYENEININSKSKIEISSTSTSSSKTAISASNGVTTNINKNKTADVIINGDIKLTGSLAEGYEKTQANINFVTENSKLNGKITTGSTYSPNAESNIEFSNGATWNNTGNSNVTNLTFDNGIINNTSSENGIAVENLKGNGGEINMAAAINEKGEAVSGKIEIGKIENNNAHFDINYKGNDNLEVSQEKAKEVFDKLTDNITVGEGELKADVKLEEGFVKGGYTADLVVDKNGNQVGNIDYKLNSMVEGMRDLATINLLTWRQEMNSLNKRMGELRNSTGEHGVWSRVYTGKIENGSKYDNDYQTYQVGYDKKYTVDNGVMFVGGLVSYTDGETDYALGHGENYSVGAGIYATWLNNDGQFADVVLKQSRLHNKFDVTSKDGNKSQSGDYNNWGTSLSGQYGKRFDLNDKFFIEPSVELTLGRVDDTTYTTSAGVDVHQDTMYSLVGNVGTSVGYKFSDKGNVYARAALVKEFQGDIDTEYEKDGALERTSEDLGDTWAEFGVGVNYRFVENMNVYVDVQKTGEATVDNKWQANLGFRYEF